MYIGGKNNCSEILKNKIEIKQVLISSSFNDQFIFSELKKNKIETKITDKFQLDKLVSKNHQGIILDIEGFKYSNLEDIVGQGLIIILDHLEDPHNFGAIIRSAAAFSVAGIIIPKDRSVSVNETVINTSAGTIFQTKIVCVTNLVNTIKQLKKENYWLVGTDVNGTDINEIDFKDNLAIVIGNEGRGMSRLVKENCDFLAKIPIGQINSLNASVAAGIFMYEATKRRNDEISRI